jgi:hypothetical protein
MHKYSLYTIMSYQYLTMINWKRSSDEDYKPYLLCKVISAKSRIFNYLLHANYLLIIEFINFIVNCINIAANKIIINIVNLKTHHNAKIQILLIQRTYTFSNNF